MPFKRILAKYRAVSFSEADKGRRFERLMRAYLLTAPPYSSQLSQVWLWHDFPYKKSISASDAGIDLVAKTINDEYWAIQCKCYGENQAINKAGVDSFLATSSREFIDGNGKSRAFSKRLWISTTNKWGSEAEKAISNQKPAVLRIGLNDLINAPVDWDKLEEGAHGKPARLSQKKPRKHQEDAIACFRGHFAAGNSRGKLIMACGTGKTYTSLKIAESEGARLVLFLAPSISLVGQTLREWSYESAEPIWPICVCSDPSVSQISESDEAGEKVIDLAWPATTDPQGIAAQLKLAEKYNKTGMTVVFSTYQSIERVSEAQKINGAEFDLVICDEAHRSTGVALHGQDESAFIKVHDNDFIKAKKRLYMTATPRIYEPAAKQKAKENLATVCSMDDPLIYGEEVYRIGFGEAVDKQLLAEYKVLVFTITQKDIPPEILADVADKEKAVDMEDASKLVGCVNALSKRNLIDHGWLKSTDPAPMRKAVAFCQTIRRSKLIAADFNEYKDKYLASLPEEKRAGLVEIAARHVDGAMGAVERASALDWLNSAPAEGNECRIISNVRCLSEGVDVPSLDAILFLSSRDSQIDVVQSVGRVMRKAPGKKYGYIIIPILVPEDEQADLVLDNHERFKPVWTVLAALRAHDDRFDARVKRIELNKRGPTPPPPPPPGGKNGGDTDFIDKGDDDNFVIIGGLGGNETAAISLDRLSGLQSAVYAKMVAKVGNRRYWEQWASDVSEIAKRYAGRIRRLISQPGEHQSAFAAFLQELRRGVNPALNETQAVDMLAQHYITKPVFEALFENYSFAGQNPVSQALQAMIALLEEQAFDKDTIVLSRFYESVRQSVSRIDNPEARQKIITELYDKFFRTAFPLAVQQLGIVYTPIEIVDFINHSVADILQSHFGKSLSDPGVNLLDPFTGTGSFIARLLESGLIAKEALPEKYRNGLFANEIILLAYYIASINIENAYHAAMGGKIAYEPFGGICLTDTFQMGEEAAQASLSPRFLKRNAERAQREANATIQVIVGNPPYSIGQRSANDNAQNQTYPRLESRIAATYIADTDASSKKAVYDSYIKAFRWASDRLSPHFGGVVAFVINAGWLLGNSMNGLRKSLVAEYDDIYVFNLRGNQRTSGELSRKEGGKIFGQGSRAPICVTILVKKPASGPKPAARKARVHYKDIGDYLSRDEKLKIIAKAKSALSPAMDWTELAPDENGDWLAHGNDLFGGLIALGDKSKNGERNTFFKPVYSLGLATGRDSWCYNFSRINLETNIKQTISFFNDLLNKSHNSDKYNPEKISWSREFEKRLKHKRQLIFSTSSFFKCSYRPFCKINCYFNQSLNAMTYKLPQLLPTADSKGLIICVSGIGSLKPFSCLITNRLPSLDTLEKTQCFPLYYYEQASHARPTLMDSGEKQFVRKEALTDFILERGRALYGKRVEKEDIFYYVYGLLHSPDYREKFANDLKKSLPRLPLLEKPAEFWAFSKAGRELAKLHLNYESQPPCPQVKITGNADGGYRVEKMRFAKKGDKSAIIYNDNLALSEIPLAAYDYVVNGRSAIEWVMERYQIKTDKASGIVNDPNDWAKEHGDRRYIFNLLQSVITVSLETMKIVKSLPRLEFGESG